MNRSAYVRALRSEGARLAGAAAGSLALPVPTCPDWNVADLLFHTGEVFGFWRRIADGELAGPEGYQEPDRPADDELVAWYEDESARLAAVLEQVDPAEPRWSWTARRDAGFIQRRMAQEAAVHCQDALLAVGRVEPVDRALAVDGIDEFLTHFRRPEPPAGLPADGVHLHATDGAGEWTVRPGDGGWQVVAEHGKGAAAVRGSASDLLLWLWGRRGQETLEVFGDAGVPAVFHSGFIRS
ncbi:maleylpyruvate isomerase family mycothiol-dependent enzyme [Kitasatospora sp. NPDC094015]|uniref:maleylpyruvate isomerase family mycothiol-dependent enzyme n=1 Tax=Kitasatospora sp. NPDC094015 TaxID=3155205 RepID=UPI00332A9FCD